MAVTTPDNLWSPDSGSTIDTIHSDMATMQQSVQTAFTNKTSAKVIVSATPMTAGTAVGTLRFW
jgi:hypothetical protein